MYIVRPRIPTSEWDYLGSDILVKRDDAPVDGELVNDDAYMDGYGTSCSNDTVPVVQKDSSVLCIPRSDVNKGLSANRTVFIVVVAVAVAFLIILPTLYILFKLFRRNRQDSRIRDEIDNPALRQLPVLEKHDQWQTGGMNWGGKGKKCSKAKKIGGDGMGNLKRESFTNQTDASPRESLEYQMSNSLPVAMERGLAVPNRAGSINMRPRTPPPPFAP